MTEYYILWIDDDVDNSELAPEVDALKEMGCHITSVTNPDELQTRMFASFDCIIIDLSLPIGKKFSPAETQFGARTGFVLLKMIKEKHPTAKTIVYSVFDAPEVINYCRNNNIPYWNKSQYLADDFAKDVMNVINTGALTFENGITREELH